MCLARNGCALRQKAGARHNALERTDACPRILVPINPYMPRYLPHPCTKCIDFRAPVEYCAKYAISHQVYEKLIKALKIFTTTFPESNDCLVKATDIIHYFAY